MAFIKLVILEGKQKPGSLGNVLCQAMALLGFHIDYKASLILTRTSLTEHSILRQSLTLTGSTFTKGMQRSDGELERDSKVDLVTFWPAPNLPRVNLN